VRARILIAMAALALACSSSQPAAAICATDPRVETFSPGLASKGAAGMTVKILTATPAPVQQGLNDWVIELLDANGQPLDGATIDVKPTMPDHGHGSPTVATVTPQGQGRYDLSNINLSMRGVWLVTLVVSSTQGGDQVSFTFCVDGTA
jgi:hypothetical protein